ncbi:hypothetical protein [Bradyrhizobium sp. SRS-191]|uniref:hypothetical protein n=1 Tax=Bradyrhizobium sp. SRS-191 TaxID=2962606 RepID=UPI00211F0E96|nr:hypothetical protein [Bradyrhizobium sp. SRS-191]
MQTVPNPNQAGELRGYGQQWTVPSVEDLARGRSPLYLPGDDPARDNPGNSPWLPNYRETPPSRDPQSSLPGSASDLMAGPTPSATLKALMALAALGRASGANGAPGQGLGTLVSRPAGPAVLFGLGGSPPAPRYDQTGGGALADLLATLVARNPDDQSSLG